MAQYLLSLLVVLLTCHKVTLAVISSGVIDQAIDEGDSASFTCQATGEPTPTITWYCNGILVDETNTQKYITSRTQLSNTTINSSIVIMKVKSTDVGTYACNATDANSTGISSGILTVYVAPTIIAPMEGQQFDILEDNYLSITCTAVGYPPPSVIWKKNANHGSGGYNSSRVTISGQWYSPTGVGNETSVSLTLIMIGVTKEDIGIYRCVASNVDHSTIVAITVLYGERNADFYLGFLRNGRPSVIIANSNPHWVSYFIEAPGIRFERTGVIAPNSVKHLTLPVQIETSSHTHAYKGVHLRLNNSNVAVLGQNSVHKSTTDTFLVMPFSRVCVTEYVYYGISVSDGLNKSRSVVLIVGNENDTSVILTVTQNTTISIDGFNIELPLDRQRLFVIRALQTVYVASYNDLSGTKIVADKPVSVFSGHECAKLPSNVTNCDHLIEQMPPTTLWGKEHYTMPLASQPYSIKILAAHDSTNVEIYCNNTLLLVYRYLNKGDFFTKALQMDEYCAVYSNREVLIVQFSHGDHIDNHNGGAVMMVVPALKQYFSIFDVSTLHAPNFVHHINIIVTAHCFHPEVMYMVTAEGLHQSLEEETWVPIKVNGRAKMYTTQMNISEGIVKIIHTMPSALMTVVAYGFVNDQGYGHVGWNQKFFTGSFPHIINPPLNQVINLEANNHNVSLHCETDKRLFITWEKENDNIIFDRANGINSSILTLINLQPEDAGNYRCVVKDSFYGSCSSDYATITINVRDPTVIIQPNVAYAATPFSGVFTCSAKGYHYMYIRWFRGNDFLPLPEKCSVSTNRSSEITISTLEIPNPTIVDVGKYSCYVELRDTNKAIRVSAELRISDPPIQPTINTSSLMPIYLTINNYNLSLECVTVDMPISRYKYTWKKLTGNPLPLQRMEGEYLPHMTINNLKPEDHGDYQCIVTNSTGTIKSQIEEVIIKVGRPMIVKQPVYVAVGVNDVAVIDCVVSSYGDVIITWKKLNSTLPNSAVVDNETKSVNEIRSVLRIPNVIGYYKGYYYATIKNSAGEINSTMIYLNVSIPCPEMIMQPLPTTVKSGEIATFQCLAYSYGDFAYHWKRSDHSMLPSNANVVNFTTESLLIISNAQVFNEGNYCCVASNDCGTEDTVSCAWLEVETSIKFVIQPNVSVEYKENKIDVTPFECLAEGHVHAGRIHYLWEKYYPLNNSWIKPSDRVVNVTSRYLKFNMITEEDEGVYHCVAINEDGPKPSNNSSIIVYGPVVISHITGNTVTFEGGSVILICNVTNDVDSSLEITWQHNNRSIADHDRIMISNTTDGATGQVQSMLYIDPVNRTDKGEYKCSALNHLKCVSEATTNLTVEYAPIVLIDTVSQPSDKVLYVGDTDNIICTAEGLPIPTVKWYNDTKLVDSSTLSHLILDIPTNITHNTTYTCIATNYAGNQMHTSELKITVVVKAHVARCHPLEAPRNGRIRYSNEDITVFECNDSYNHIGPNVLYCDNGTWDGNPPTCAQTLN